MGTCTVAATLSSRHLPLSATAETVAESVAQEVGVVGTRRHVFLDHDPRPSAIREAIVDAATQSREHPTVAIAHPSRALVEALEETLPTLYEQGVGIYPLSLIVRAVAPAPRP